MNKILVIGESAIDIYIYCEAIRLAPDVPVPVLNINQKTQNDGMAMNVFNNIKVFHNNIDIMTNDNWRNLTKTRYVHEQTNHMFFRVDKNENIKRINIRNISYDYEAIIVSDYNKGFLKEEDIQEICSNHKNVFVDTKKKLGNWVANAKIIKINDYEFQNSKPFLDSSFENKIIHTLGPNGCEFNGRHYPVKSVKVADSSGAGDSFMAAFVIKYLETFSFEKSIIYANEKASWVVTQKGVVTINK